MSKIRVVLIAAATAACAVTVSNPAGAQSKDAKPKDSTTAQPGSTADAAKSNPRKIRVHLMDGSIVAGELTVSTISVKTEFGTLTVPVEQIVAITPGLQSHTEMAAKIKKLLAGLGGPDYKGREQAQKDLLAMGVAVRDIVAEHTDSDNAELKRRATEIVAKLDEQVSDADDDFDGDGSKPKKWVKFDIVKTTKFTIAGQISPSNFQLQSKYGPLKVSLNDIRRTERQFVAKEAIVAKLRVPGQKLIQRGLQSSKIRVKAGDLITVSASGSIVMTPWGSSTRSGPDGGSNFSYWYDTSGGTRKQYYGGTLMARIGSSGPYIKIGSKARFRAKKSGLLQFGIAMYNSYASSSYYYPGEYKLRIKVDPARK